ncbi:hypothetical protein Aperf_G00000073506 [Anoplocephala perfoliata]
MHWVVVAFVFLNFICLIHGKHHVVHVHMLFRHGDRSSITPYPFKGYDPSAVWPEGYGQLTQIGIEQHFLLGKWLHNRYQSFLSPNYNVSTFHMRSSDVDRALMSAQAMMAGFFHKSETSLEKYGLHWRPVPTHTVLKDSDKLLAIAPCPRFTQRREELLNTEESLALLTEHEKTITTIENFYGIKNISLPVIWKINDDLICLRSHNATRPAFYTNEVAEELDNITNKMFQIYFTDQELLKLSSGVFLKEAFNQMEKIIAGKSRNSPSIEDLPKISAFSAHDTNVAPLLGAFGAYANESKPAYASLVALELFAPSPDAPNEEFILKLLYKRGWKDNASEYIQFAACRDQRKPEHGCPFVVVRESVASLFMTEDESVEACKAAWMPFKYKLIVVLSLGGFLIFFFFTLFATCIISRRRQQNSSVRSEVPYSPLLTSPPTV